MILSAVVANEYSLRTVAPSAGCPLARATETASASAAGSALSTDVLSEGYFGDEGMLAYVLGVQRQEIRRGLSAVKHQDLAGSNIGDDHKEYFLGEKALLAGGAANTMNQF